jgi:hypothetical protein
MSDSLTIIIAGFLTIFLAGTIQGLTASGFVLVSVPINNRGWFILNRLRFRHIIQVKH